MSLVRAPPDDGRVRGGTGRKSGIGDDFDRSDPVAAPDDPCVGKSVARQTRIATARRGRGGPTIVTELRVIRDL